MAAKVRKYNQGVKSRTGKYPRGGRHRRAPVTPAERISIYERDGWTCQLCLEPVDKDLHHNHRMAATVDHIECQSWALIPDHSLLNLRLAHRACNARRSNRVAV